MDFCVWAEANKILFGVWDKGSRYVLSNFFSLSNDCSLSHVLKSLVRVRSFADLVCPRSPLPHAASRVCSPNVPFQGA